MYCVYVKPSWCREFEKELERARESKKDDTPYRPSYLKALVRTFGLRYMLLGLGAAFEELFIRVFQGSAGSNAKYGNHNSWISE